MGETRPPRHESRHDQRPSGRKGLARSLAASARWAGEERYERGWEENLADFLAAMLTWGGIGWLLDRWLGTAPALLLAGVVLGNGLGIYLLWIRSNAQAARSDAGPAADDTGAVGDEVTDGSDGRAA